VFWRRLRGRELFLDGPADSFWKLTACTGIRMAKTTTIRCLGDSILTRFLGAEDWIGGTIQATTRGKPGYRAPRIPRRNPWTCPQNFFARNRDPPAGKLRTRLGKASSHALAGWNGLVGVGHFATAVFTTWDARNHIDFHRNFGTNIFAAKTPALKEPWQGEPDSSRISSIYRC